MQTKRCVLIVMLSLNLAACDSSSRPTANNNFDEFSVGEIRSTELTYIDIADFFNSWLISASGDARQVMLKVKEEIGQFEDPALWALAVRTNTDPSGIWYAQDMEVKLFKNYTPRQDICCVNTRPFSDFDQADVSYVAVGGFIDFEFDSPLTLSPSAATFDLDFQRETFVGSGEFVGQIVKVKGCWFIVGEGEVSGCYLN